MTTHRKRSLRGLPSAQTAFTFDPASGAAEPVPTSDPELGAAPVPLVRPDTAGTATSDVCSSRTADADRILEHSSWRTPQDAAPATATRYTVAALVELLQLLRGLDCRRRSPVDAARPGVPDSADPGHRSFGPDPAGAVGAQTSSHSTTASDDPAAPRASTRETATTPQGQLAPAQPAVPSEVK